MRWMVLTIGVCMALIAFLYARNQPARYTAVATVFPLNAGNDNANAASALSNLLGLNETPKSFIQEASINIVDLALSRNTREAVALEPLPGRPGTLVADEVIREYNETKAFYQKTLPLPAETSRKAALAGNLLKHQFFAKINKNGILDIRFTSTRDSLVGSITRIFVDKISDFYKELKIRKAKMDYDFMTSKVDSLEQVISSYDSRAVGLSGKTLFVSPDKLQFQLPKENLSMEKSRVMRQRDISSDNREEALWRLQKVTPIVAMLDSPEPPYEVEKPSSLVYAAVGFVVGLVLALFLFILPMMLRFIRSSLRASFGVAET